MADFFPSLATVDVVPSLATADVVMADAYSERLLLDAKAWPPESLQLFRKVLQNVLDSPHDPKFRKLKLSNARINGLLSESGAQEAFRALGWISTGDALELPATASLDMTTAVLKGTELSPGDPIALTVLRGALKSKLELPCNTLFSGLAAAIEQSEPLGRIPRKRQRLLIGVPPKPLQESFPHFASMTIAELGLKAFKLEDTWEEMVADLRATRASFASLASVLACKKTLQDNFEFLLDSAKSLLKARAMAMDASELRDARGVFKVLWPPGDPSTRDARLAHCAACTPLAALAKEEDGSAIQFPLRVERTNLFRSALEQICEASVADLRKSLQVTFVGEAAEDAGGPRREFFNDFGRACADEEVWQRTAAGSLVPSPFSAAADVFRGCGRIFGLALCQAENAAQEQRVRANATLQELLVAVTQDDDNQEQQLQKLLLGATLSRPFLRCVQADNPESVEELQAELNAEQSESAPDFRGSSTFLTSQLQDIGLEGQLTFSREVQGNTVDLTVGGRAIVVTDATKLDWLRAVLKHELVEAVSEPAASFRQGVSEAAGMAYLALLSAGELQKEWSGLAHVSDDALKIWQKQAIVNPARAQQAAWFFEILWEEHARDAPQAVIGGLWIPKPSRST